jgi:hypothetical protein
MLATTPVLRQLKQIRDAAASSGPERPRGGDGEPGHLAILSPDQLGEGLDRLERGDVRFRSVLDMTRV